jgi:MSHA biogenesis protein MshO
MRQRNPSTGRGQRGFTLVEAIAVIVIMAIIGGVIAVFIQMPAERYASSIARGEASDLADHAMRRMTRDLRLALPNSTRVSGNYIEFLQTKAGLRYLAEDDINTPGGTKYLSWNDTAAREFIVVGGLPTGRTAPVVGDSVVVYNLGPSQEPGNAYNCTGPCNRATISAVSPADGTITMTTNPFALQGAAGGVTLMSPSKRFHVVDSPVTYGCDPVTRRLTRYWGYTIASGQPTPPSGGSSALLAENVVSCEFKYTNLSSQRSGLVGISLELKVQDGSGGSVLLVHQVHVDNTP